MARRRRFIDLSVYESYSDMVLLMLALFIFLFTMMLMTSTMTGADQVESLRKEVKELRQKLAYSEAERDILIKDVDAIAKSGSESYMQQVIDASTFGRKDFEIFIRGLKDLPGNDFHVILDASGSMHGLSTFLVPLLRVIAIKSGKQMTAITWFSDNQAETYTGSMGGMLDRVMRGAPFVGNLETVGQAFRVAKRRAPVPGAYLLIGDEPGDDMIQYSAIPAPVFTLPLGRDDGRTVQAFQTLASKTGGKILFLNFQ